MELPLFVKANAIVPMYAENNNPEAVSDTNTKGTDRSQRIVEFFATEGDGTFTQYEDDGSSIENNTTEDDSYGTIDNISYGEHVSTVYSSKAAGGTATFTAEARRAATTATTPTAPRPSWPMCPPSPRASSPKNGGSALNVVEVNSQETFDAATPEAGQAVYFYSKTPNLNHYGSDADGTEAEQGESFNNTKITTNPKVYVKFAKTDVAAAAQTLELGGFVNADATLTADRLNENLSAPTNLAAPEDVTTQRASSSPGERSMVLPPTTLRSTALCLPWVMRPSSRTPTSPTIASTPTRFVRATPRVTPPGAMCSRRTPHSIRGGTSPTPSKSPGRLTLRQP